jgi:hypothetical protein
VPKTARLITPELALVDPELAAVARRSLPEPDDTLSRVRSAETRPPHRLHSMHGPDQVDPATIRDLRAARSSRARWDWAAAALRWRLRLPALAVAIVIVSATIAAVLEERAARPGAEAPPAVALGEPMPTSSTTERGQAESRAASRPPREPAQTSGRSAGGGQPDTARSRNLAWAPVAEASGYSVELYRGSERVFASTTRGAQIAIPATWQNSGRAHRLVPGDYRWYVWPIVAGKRAATAIVQTNLTVE